MTGDEANCIQAWSAIAQAVGAFLALGAAVAVPYIQRAVEARIRIEIKAGMLWITPSIGLAGPSAHFSPVQENYQENFERYGECFPCIEITNHATFPITITDVGALQGKKSPRRSAFLGCVIGAPFGELPCTIQPMSSQRIVFTDALFNYSFSGKTLAYAMTANGQAIYTSASIWSFLAKMKKVNGALS